MQLVVMVVSYIWNMFNFSFISIEVCDLDECKRWKKKIIKVRILIGVLIVICSIFIVILIVIYESGYKNIECIEKQNGKVVNNNIIKFVYISDIYYDFFYDKNIF